MAPVLQLDIAEESTFAQGQSFGDVGEYRLLTGTASFGVDPSHPRNTVITDLDLAPRHPDGSVRFWADFAVLQPVDPQRGNRRILFDVVNRGRKTALSLNNVPTGEPTAPLLPGNGFLMRHGYTVVWCGWQADVPPTPGLIGLQAPEAAGPDGPLNGRIMGFFQCDEPGTVLHLSHRGHIGNPAAVIDDPSATLTVRDHPNDARQVIERDQWSFVRVEDESEEPQPSHIYLPAGFEPGRIYELVYDTTVSRIVGLGFASVRDINSFLKYETDPRDNPCAGQIDYAYGFGRSQSGRFLRQMIHLGLNEDEEERTALDGFIPHVGGAMRGEFNLRFGQPSMDVCYLTPEFFPFTDTPQRDPVTGEAGSMLDALEARGKVPRIMFTNTSAEYWRGDAALIHTNLETMTDAAESEHVRRYHFAGTQHGSGEFPPLEVRVGEGPKGQQLFNSVDYAPLLRAALVNLDRWVSTGELPPASRHPSLDEGTAVESESLLDRLRSIPGLAVPERTPKALRLDYGPEVHSGRATTLPADAGEPYPALVSDLDDDCNEVRGIRLPDVEVPIATYTGWNLRHPDIGNTDLFIGITGGLAGSTIPFPATREAREKSGDPRLSIEERYADRNDYEQRVKDAIGGLVEAGYMLVEDTDEVVERALQKYDYYMGSET